MAQQKEGRRFFRAGDWLELGKDWRVEVLWPPEEGGTGKAEEDGLVLLLLCGEERLLWAGSISGEVEQKLVEKYGEKLRAGVLIQGPSPAMNLTEGWLKSVRPIYLVRSWKALADDPSLSVEFHQNAKEIGLTLVKLQESGAVQLKPDSKSGGWLIRRWLSE